MVEPPVPLTALSEDQRAQAHTRFTIIRPALEDGVTQAQVARTHNIPKSTIQRGVKRDREKGLAGLADTKGRSDKGKSRREPSEAITRISGLALQSGMPLYLGCRKHRGLATGSATPSSRARKIFTHLFTSSPALFTGLLHSVPYTYHSDLSLLYRLPVYGHATSTPCFQLSARKEA